ncbi:MAG: ribonuclease H [Desulfobacterium sp.]|jgi:ribonuclease HI|nr:ribonuclease H [Desulfobacterium sp.]
MGVLEELKQIQREIEELNRRSAMLLDQLTDQVSGPISEPPSDHLTDQPSEDLADQQSESLTGSPSYPVPVPGVEGSIFDIIGEESSFEETSLEGGVEISRDSPIFIYTDGACSGNPGPAGSGVVVVQNNKVVHEISISLGVATNNIAELTAIKLGLELVKDHHSTPVTIYTDSTYSIGILTKNWKAKANVELVGSIRQLMKPFKRLKLIHVKGHSGHPLNERADLLAVRGSTSS